MSKDFTHLSSTLLAHQDPKTREWPCPRAFSETMNCALSPEVTRYKLPVTGSRWPVANLNF